MTPNEQRNQHKTTQEIVDGILATTHLQVNDMKKKKGSRPQKIGGKSQKKKG